MSVNVKNMAKRNVFAGFLHPQAKEMVLNLLNYFKNVEKMSTNTNNIKNLASIHEKVAEALKLSVRSVERIVQENRKGLPMKRKQRRTRKKKTEMIGEAAKISVRNVIYDLYASKTHITLPVLRDALRNKEMLDIGLRSLGELIKKLGFRYKKDCNRRYLCELPRIASERVQFLRKYVENYESKFRKVVFLDETWVFANGSGSKSWQDDSVKSVKRKKGCGSGKRFIVLHAGSSSGFINGASLIFSSTSKSADYHDNMNCELFEKWVREKLIPNLEEPSIIVLDNASYHSRTIYKQPTSSWKKDQIFQWLVQENQNPSPGLLKSELLVKAKSIQKPKLYVVDEMLRENGHEVLRLPPYHCQFNAIELIWAGAKSYYEKNCGDGLNAKQVEEVWEKAVEHITEDYWRKAVEHTEKIILDWWNREKMLDIQVAPLIISNTEDGESSSEESDDSEFE